MDNLKRLEAELNRLMSEARRYDSKVNQKNRLLFDERLFSCRSVLLQTCVMESMALLQSIISKQQEPGTNSEVTGLLSEKLLAQTEAITKELENTVRTDKNEPVNKRTHLNSELQKHIEWEKRLQLLVEDKRDELNRATSDHYEEARQKLLATEERLVRCLESKSIVVQQLKALERRR